MRTHNSVRMDPGTLEGRDGSEIEIVVPYTEPSVTEAVLRRVSDLTAGLNARVTLLAVHAVPYPSAFVCPTVVHAHLVERLMDLAASCPFEVQPQVVLARDREEGFRFALKPGSTLVIGTRSRFWRTSEERLARSLAHDGHNVALIHL